MSEQKKKQSSKQGRNKAACEAYRNRGTREINKCHRLIRAMKRAEEKQYKRPECNAHKESTRMRSYIKQFPAHIIRTAAQRANFNDDWRKLA